MRLNNWLRQYSRHLLPARQIEFESKQSHLTHLEESQLFERQRRQLEEDIPNIMGEYYTFEEDQAQKSMLLKRNIIEKVFNKSKAQMDSWWFNRPDKLDEKDFIPSFTTRYLQSIDGKDYLLIGTYHTLQESAVDVMEKFKQFDPDSVVLELCEDRFFQLNDVNINEKTQPHRVYNALQANPDDLSFITKSCEFQVAYEASLRSKKGCVAIPADLNLFYIQNRSKYLRAQCECNVNQLFDKNSPMKQVLSYFFFGLIPYMLKKIVQRKVDVNEQVYKMEQFLNSESRYCITNLIYYEREEHMLHELCNNSQGQKILGVVGFSHLESLYEMLLKREKILTQELESINKQYGIDLYDFESQNLQSDSYEQIAQRTELYDQLQIQIDNAIKDYEKKDYCTKLN